MAFRAWAGERLRELEELVTDEQRAAMAEALKPEHIERMANALKSREWAMFFGKVSAVSHDLTVGERKPTLHEIENKLSRLNEPSVEAAPAIPPARNAMHGKRQRGIYGNSGRSSAPGFGQVMPSEIFASLQWSFRGSPPSDASASHKWQKRNTKKADMPTINRYENNSHIGRSINILKNAL